MIKNGDNMQEKNAYRKRKKKIELILNDKEYEIVTKAIELTRFGGSRKTRQAMVDICRFYNARND